MDLGKLGMRGTTAGGVTVYPMGPWSGARREGRPKAPGYRIGAWNSREILSVL